VPNRGVLSCVAAASGWCGASKMEVDQWKMSTNSKAVHQGHDAIASQWWRSVGTSARGDVTGAASAHARLYRHQTRSAALTNTAQAATRAHTGNAASYHSGVARRADIGGKSVGCPP